MRKALASATTASARPLARGSECGLNILGDLVRLGIEAAPLFAPAASSISFNILRVARVGRSPAGRPRGRAGERSPSKAPVVFRLSPGQEVDNPVMFPPGRARLATKPEPTGSLSNAMNNGNRRSCLPWHERVAVGPPETMMSTLRRTSSAARPGNRSALPSEDRHSMTMFFPSRSPSSRRPCRNASVRPAIAEREVALRISYPGNFLRLLRVGGRNSLSARELPVTRTKIFPFIVFASRFFCQLITGHCPPLTALVNPRAGQIIVKIGDVQAHHVR